MHIIFMTRVTDAIAELNRKVIENISKYGSFAISLHDIMINLDVGLNSAYVIMKAVEDYAKKNGFSVTRKKGELVIKKVS